MNETELKKIRQAAEAGVPKAMFNLSAAYLNGEGVEKDLKQYFEWTKKAAEAGVPQAMSNLSLAYLIGEGVEKDLKQYFEWTKKAAEAGDPAAMFNLSLAYLIGEGVEKDLEQYFNWTKKAAEAGDPTAMFNLSLAYHNGEGVEKDLEQYFNWTKKAAEVETRPGRKVILGGIIRICGPDHSDTDLELIGQLQYTLLDLHNIINEIIEDKHLIKGDEAEWTSAAHFTQGEALPSILKPDSNVLRLYNVSYMNDPDEGKRLLHKDLKGQNDALIKFLDTENETPDDHHRLRWDNSEYCAYVGSFTKDIDRLDLWRAYGNNGDGFCIVTPITAFDKSADTSDNYTVIDSISIKTPFRENDAPAKKDDSPEKRAKLRLYKVLYTKEDAQYALKRLQEPLENLEDLSKTLKTGVGDAACDTLNEIIRVLFCKIRYLYKSDEYQTENEARIIEVVDTDDNRLCHEDKVPYKLYVESKPIFFKEKGSAIIIGPRINNKTVWEWDLKHRTQKNNWHDKIEIRHSKVHYR